LPLVAVLSSKRFRPELPIPTPAAAAVTTATGAGLYGRLPRLSRLFLENFLRPISLDFRPFRLIRKVHQQPISTGGNFIAVSVENFRGVLYPQGRRGTADNLSRASPVI
jgi:hypothetical protein